VSLKKNAIATVALTGIAVAVSSAYAAGFQLTEQSLLAVGINHLACLSKSQLTKCMQATGFVEINEYTSKVKYQVFNLTHFHNRGQR
jgi:hypothetical protein